MAGSRLSVTAWRRTGLPAIWFDVVLRRRCVSGTDRAPAWAPRAQALPQTRFHRAPLAARRRQARRGGRGSAAPTRAPARPPTDGRRRPARRPRRRLGCAPRIARHEPRRCPASSGRRGPLLSFRAGVPCLVPGFHAWGRRFLPYAHQVNAGRTRCEVRVGCLHRHAPNMDHGGRDGAYPGYSCTLVAAAADGSAPMLMWCAIGRIHDGDRPNDGGARRLRGFPSAKAGGLAHRVPRPFTRRAAPARRPSSVPRPPGSASNPWPDPWAAGSAPGCWQR